MYEEHRDTINGTIAMKVQDITIKRNAEDYLKRMKPVVLFLIKCRVRCKLSDAVGVWKVLESQRSACKQHTHVVLAEELCTATGGGANCDCALGIKKLN